MVLVLEENGQGTERAGALWRWGLTGEDRVVREQTDLFLEAAENRL